MQDRRTLSSVEPSIARDGAGRIQDSFRSGVEEEVDKYAIFGRRTIILDAVPVMSGISDTDADNYAPDDDRDGGASAVDPYPIGKGPDNKFRVASGLAAGDVRCYGCPAGRELIREGKNVMRQTFITPLGTTTLDRDSTEMEQLHFIAGS